LPVYPLQQKPFARLPVNDVDDIWVPLASGPAGTELLFERIDNEDGRSHPEISTPLRINGLTGKRVNGFFLFQRANGPFDVPPRLRHK
jgi:hypothetical protein